MAGLSTLRTLRADLALASEQAHERLAAELHGFLLGAVHDLGQSAARLREESGPARAASSRSLCAPEDEAKPAPAASAELTRAPRARAAATPPRPMEPPRAPELPSWLLTPCLAMACLGQVPWKCGGRRSAYRRVQTAPAAGPVTLRWKAALLDVRRRWEASLAESHHELEVDLSRQLEAAMNSLLVAAELPLELKPVSRRASSSSNGGGELVTGFVEGTVDMLLNAIQAVRHAFGPPSGQRTRVRAAP